MTRQTSPDTFLGLFPLALVASTTTKQWEIIERLALQWYTDLDPPENGYRRAYHKQPYPPGFLEARTRLAAAFAKEMTDREIAYGLVCELNPAICQAYSKAHDARRIYRKPLGAILGASWWASAP